VPISNFNRNASMPGRRMDATDFGHSPGRRLTIRGNRRCINVDIIVEVRVQFREACR
jgi:hypothetical protein